MARQTRTLGENGLSELVITREVSARPEEVWNAWTKPDLVKMWWGPKFFTAPFAEIDLRVGGKYLYCMRGPDGKDYWSTGIFREIVPGKKIVATDSFADEKGNVVPGSHYGMGEGFPLEMVLTVEMEDLGGKTRLTLHHSGMPGGKHEKGARQGWNESLDKLVELLRR